METIRPRASVLVVNNNKFVLIFRHKNNQDYYAIPGGGIEPGETLELAAIREVDEELGLRLKNIKLISEINNGIRHDYNLIAQTDDVNISVTGPEKNQLNDSKNLFRPEWHSKESFRRDIEIYPETAREMFKNFINNL